jgi:CRISPR-associated endonuclease Csy4
MDHYFDTDLRPDPEFPSYQLLAALYAKLHRALVALASDAIGVSFPDFDLKSPHLGTRVRLHGELGVLSTLLASDWLVGIRDHVALTQPAPVPDNAKHRRVGRVQVKSSPERMRRRLMRRQNIDEQGARQRIPDESARLTHLPFVQMRSASSGQTFRLFIEHGPIQPNAVAGDFNAYGLSQEATIPWF